MADDPARRAEAGVPDDVVFQTKTQIALSQLCAARATGIEAEVALLDAGYGNDTDLRDGITDLQRFLGYESIATTTRLYAERQPPRCNVTSTS